MWSQLYDRPGIKRLRDYVEAMLAQKGDAVEFCVLYGSMARDNWSAGSDFDLLMGLRIDDGKRFLDRLCEYDRIAPGPIEALAYSRSEWQEMWRQLRLTFLEAADHGIPLFDRGEWARIRREFEELLAAGAIERLKGGWALHLERRPLVTQAAAAAKNVTAAPQASAEGRTG